MRTRFATLLSVMLLSLTLNAQKTRIGQWWNDLSVYQFNKMPPRTNVIPYSDENGVENLEYMNSERILEVLFHRVSRKGDRAVLFQRL